MVSDTGREDAKIRSSFGCSTCTVYVTAVRAWSSDTRSWFASSDSFELDPGSTFSVSGAVFSQPSPLYWSHVLARQYIRSFDLTIRATLSDRLSDPPMVKRSLNDEYPPIAWLP